MGLPPGGRRGSWRGLGFDVRPVKPGHSDGQSSARTSRRFAQQYNKFVLGNFISGELPLIRPNATLVTHLRGRETKSTSSPRRSAPERAGAIRSGSSTRR